MSAPNISIGTLPKPFQDTWDGESKIVIGVDIGTTQSGVAFSFLEKGVVQRIHRVTNWPGQEAANLQSKIPTVIWYDQSGKAVSFGAEAVSPRANEDAEDHDWQLAKHFKLHLHPSDMNVKYELKLNALPTSVSLQQIYSDFMKYLLEHTRSFFEDRIVNGALIWNKYRARLEVVIAHPNGWGLREQAFLRAAAIDAGFVSNSSSHLVQFVTEAEASVHFCVHHTNLSSSLQPGARFAVCDAGGSTVDTTVYSVCSTRPILKLQETRASACVQAGAIFVDLAAEKYLHKAFKNAVFCEEDIEEYTARGVKDFESALKRNFRDESEDKSVEIAGSRYNNPNLRVRRGRMALPGSVIKSFFNVCVNEIISSVDQQIQGTRVSYILLVGGFGDSPFLRQQFRDRYECQGCQVALTNDSTSKAVADGAVIWNSINSVVGRAPRFSFGIEMSTYYKPSPDFRGRETRISASGDRIVRGAWGQIVAKDVVIDVNAISRRSFWQTYLIPNPDLECFTLTVMSYSKAGEPFWVKDKRNKLEDGFKESCTIKANLTKLSGALKQLIGVHGSAYWQLDFDICMRFGGPELEAYMEWEEHGTTQKGEVTIILNSAI